MYKYMDLFIYSACELLPTCNKLEDLRVRKFDYSGGQDLTDLGRSLLGQALFASAMVPSK